MENRCLMVTFRWPNACAPDKGGVIKEAIIHARRQRLGTSLGRVTSIKAKDWPLLVPRANGLDFRCKVVVEFWGRLEQSKIEGGVKGR